MKKLLSITVCLVIALVFMSAFKSIYVNLHNAYSYRNLYNPIPDILFAAFGSILLGFVLGYLFKSKR
jgi:NhaP-type Na+/H+ or K+/H+ antiporter